MPDRDGERWTAADDAALRRAVAEGATYAEAAAELGRTRSAVRQRGRVIRAGRPGGGPPDLAARVRLLGLLADGLTLSACARVLARDPSTVWEMAARLAADGLLVRRGGASSSVRYVPA